MNKATKSELIPAGLRGKPLRFALVGALGCLLGAVVGEFLLAATAPPPPVVRPEPPPPPPPPPRAVVLVLDNSFSMMFSKMNEMQQAAVGYIERQDMTRTRLAVVGFGSESHVVSRLTNDAAALTAAVRSLKLEGSTNMSAGLRDGLAELNGATEQRYLLLFTDGSPDEQSTTTDGARAVRDAGVRLLAVATGDADRDYLGVLTGDPKLVFWADDGNFGEAFKRAERAIEPAPKAYQLVETTATENYRGGAMILRQGGWTALLGLGLALALVVAQCHYTRRPLRPEQGAAVLAAVCLSFLAGAFGQMIFHLLENALLLLTLGRVFAWGFFGAAIGFAMPLVVPNQEAHRSGMGGAFGGAVGAIAFLLVATLMNDSAGRLLGAAIVGFFIGLMIVLMEIAARRAWLRVNYGAKDVYDISLGVHPIAVGNDARRCRILAREVSPLAGRYSLGNGEVVFEDAALQRSIVHNGDTRQFGNVTITVRQGSAVPGATMAPDKMMPSVIGSPQPGGGSLPPPVNYVPPSSFVPSSSPEPSYLPPSSAPPVAPPTPPMAPPSSAPVPVAPVVPTPPPRASAATQVMPVASNWVLQHSKTPIRVAGANLTVGRAADNDIVIADPSVSSRHARLLLLAGGVELTDVGSTNGTTVNGKRIAPNQPVLLQAGDKVVLGTQEYKLERAS